MNVFSSSVCAYNHHSVSPTLLSNGTLKMPLLGYRENGKEEIQ
jgi:hypothetical protein